MATVVMPLNMLATAAILAATFMNLGSVGHQGVRAEPPMPFEDAGACPFEGCTYREWQAKATVVARKTRSATGAVAFTVRKGEKVTAVTGVVVITSPGRVRFRDPVDLPSRSGSVRIDRDETLYLLTYQGEGFTKAWFKGHLYDGLDGSTFFNALCDNQPTLCVGTIVERPKRVWWVSIRNEKGQLGWSNEPEKFDGKDALGN